MEIEQATTQEVFEPTIEDMIQTENGIPTTTSSSSLSVREGA